VLQDAFLDAAARLDARQPEHLQCRE
jgi:hypothetical protein